MATPQSRLGAAVGYHTGVTKLFLFSGRSQQGPQSFNDTWAWSAGAWALQAPATSPPPRFNAVMAYHAATTKLVLFGGRSVIGGDIVLGDTWTFDGTVWAQVVPAASPPARHMASMTVDSTGQLVLYGGLGAPNGNTTLGDTWGWNGTVWTQLA